MYEKVSEESDEVSNKRLTSMALDAARALSYLAELKYVHRLVLFPNCSSYYLLLILFSSSNMIF